MTPEEFWSILHSMPEPVPVFYRLYYNDDGSPNFYTMEDLPGNFIEVDQETYIHSRMNVKVVDGLLQIIKPTIKINKLAPGQNTGTSCHPHDVCVVVAPDQLHIKWSQVTNETSA